MNLINDELPLLHLEIKKENIDYLQSLFDQLYDISPELNIEFINDSDITGHLKIRCVDETNGSFFNMILSSNFFSKYVCTQKNLVIGINVGMIYKFIENYIECMDDNTVIIFKIESTCVDVINITITQNSQGISELNMKLIKIDKIGIIGDIAFDTVTTLDMHMFKKICDTTTKDDSECVHNNLVLDVQSISNKIIFSCNNNEIITVTNEKCNNSDVKYRFYLYYLRLYMRYIHLFPKKFKMYLKKYCPLLCIEYQLNNSNDQNMGKIQICIAHCGLS